MFKLINNHTNVTEHYAKIHYISTKAIAEEVKSDLSSRFSGSFSIVEESNPNCGWDPGGMLMIDDEDFEFALENMTIECKAQHFDMFATYIQKYEPRGDKTKYIKIHGNYWCICITVDEFENLKALVANPELALKAEAAWQKREEKLNKLADDGHIVRVMKDSEGNLYKAPKDKPTDNKLLN